MSTTIVLLGGPGSGKGTQAQRLSELLNVPHVASGDLFREHLKNRTELGLRANAFIEQGELVPDAVTIAMVRERLSERDCAEGAVLDGFPRTVSQADALQAVLAAQGNALTLVAFIRVSKETLIKRLSGRWVCPCDGQMYHELFNPPKVPGKCDSCDGDLYRRPDDVPQVQERRIEVYLEQTLPLIEYYTSKGRLVEIDGERGIEEVESEILDAIQCAG